MEYTSSSNEHRYAHSHASSIETNAINVSRSERIISLMAGSLLVASACKNHSAGGKLSKGLISAFLFYRGLSGNCPLYSYWGKEGRKARAINLRTSLIINKPVHEVYAYWRELENLPVFMQHILSVKEEGDVSHWKAGIPGSLGHIYWDAKIVKDEENKTLSWKSIQGSMIENAGKLEFSEALGGKGTALDVMITYRAPAGDIGRSVSSLINPFFKKIVQQDIIRFKEVIEGGQV